MSDDYAVSVKVSGERENRPVYGRAARMVHWITEHKEQVNATRKGEIRFCFAGNSLSVHTTNVDDSI